MNDATTSAAAREAGQRFDRIMSNLDRPVAIVTCRALGREAGSGTQRAGCLVGFATQCSIHPPRFLVCISVANHTWKVIQSAETAAVHLIPRQRFELAELFAGQTGDDVDKFARCAWHDGPGGVPLLDGCPTWIAGRIIARPDGGDADHHLLVLAPYAVGDPDPPDGGWLNLSDLADVEPGHQA